MKNATFIAGVVLLVIGSFLFFRADEANAPIENEEGDTQKTVSTSTSPTSTSPLVFDNLTEGQSIASPFVVKGSAPGTWYFEAIFDAQLLDESGAVLTQVPVIAQKDWMTVDMVPFEVDLTFNATSGTSGILIFTEDPTGLEEQGKTPQTVEVPVVFE